MLVKYDSRSPTMVFDISDVKKSGTLESKDSIAMFCASLSKSSFLASFIVFARDVPRLRNAITIWKSGRSPNALACDVSPNP